ncbi:hypothetical protein [Acinetobacter phage Ab69]|nr:hypothetical protein [Acinetobacter phage Ab69]
MLARLQNEVLKYVWHEIRESLKGEKIMNI